MGIKRRKHSASFKAKVGLEAIKEQKTSSQISSEYGVTSGQISTWKSKLLASLPDVFSGESQCEKQDNNLLTAPLYEEIGRLKMELDWLKKKATPFN